MPSRQAGSRRIISRCSERNAIENGAERAAAEIDTTLRVSPGNSAQYASTVMPPSDGPITAASFLMPSETATSCPARAMSSTVSTGKVSRYGWPVVGLMEIGEVEPNGLPSELTQMTKKRRVSIGRPGPIMSSHQPCDESSVDEAAWADGDRPVKIMTAWSCRTAGSPQVS